MENLSPPTQRRSIFSESRIKNVSPASANSNTAAQNLNFRTYYARANYTRDDDRGNFSKFAAKKPRLGQENYRCRSKLRRLRSSDMGDIGSRDAQPRVCRRGRYKLLQKLNDVLAEKVDLETITLTKRAAKKILRNPLRRGKSWLGASFCR